MKAQTDANVNTMVVERETSGPVAVGRLLNPLTVWYGHAGPYVGVITEEFINAMINGRYETAEGYEDRCKAAGYCRG